MLPGALMTYKSRAASPTLAYSSTTTHQIKYLESSSHLTSLRGPSGCPNPPLITLPSSPILRSGIAFIMATLLPAGTDPSSYPIATPPPGITSNLIDPPSLSWAGRVAMYTTLPLMLVVLVLRLYVRIRSRQFGADDCKF